MRSMTGYGSGRSTADDGTQCSVEIQSVNRRQSELMINLPRDLGSLEPRVREAVNARIARGRLVINVHHQTRTAADAAPAIDVAAARKHYEAMRALKNTLGVRGKVSIETILRAPGVMRSTEDAADPAQLWPQIETALRHALDELIAMRAQEGRHLAGDLRPRLHEIRARLADIRQRQPDAAAHYRQTLHERLQRAGLSVPIDDDRLAKEIVVFADRCDISEEITRMDSHLDQFLALAEKDEPVGRTMDFLSQEMARELNTLGAKANDLAISQFAITCKTELDKIREQVQNIE